MNFNTSSCNENSRICKKKIQSNLVSSKSKGPSKILQDIRTSTYQICSIGVGGGGGSGGAMVLGKLPVPGRPTTWITVGQGPTALTVGAGGGCLDIFALIYPFSPLSPSLWETARYRLKYCLKGPLSPKQPTNQCSIAEKQFQQLYFTNDYVIWLL